MFKRPEKKIQVTKPNEAVEKYLECHYEESIWTTKPRKMRDFASLAMAVDGVRTY